MSRPQVFYSTDLRVYVAFVNGEVVDTDFEWHFISSRMGIRTRPKGFKKE